MTKRILISLLFFASLHSLGNTINILDTQSMGMMAGSSNDDNIITEGYHFIPGESASYNVTMSLVQGTMDVTVDSLEEEGAWIHQVVNLGFLGKQDVKMLVDPNTGEVKKIISNGQEQQIPKKGDIELVEGPKQVSIKVPAGTFDCVYIKARDKEQDQIIEQWANLKAVPVLGLVKSITPSQFGPVNIELLSFKRIKWNN